MYRLIARRNFFIFPSHTLAQQVILKFSFSSKSLCPLRTFQPRFWRHCTVWIGWASEPRHWTWHSLIPRFPSLKSHDHLPPLIGKSEFNCAIEQLMQFASAFRGSDHTSKNSEFLLPRHRMVDFVSYPSWHPSLQRTAWDSDFFAQFQIPLSTLVSHPAVSSEPQIPEPDSPFTTVFATGAAVVFSVVVFSVVVFSVVVFFVVVVSSTVVVVTEAAFSGAKGSGITFPLFLQGQV